MSRILGRHISDLSTQELVFTIQFLENQRAETISAKGSMHPKFNTQLFACRLELGKRNINELPQSMLDSCGYPDVGAYD